MKNIRIKDNFILHLELSQVGVDSVSTTCRYIAYTIWIDERITFHGKNGTEQNSTIYWI